MFKINTSIHVPKLFSLQPAEGMMTNTTVKAISAAPISSFLASSSLFSSYWRGRGAGYHYSSQPTIFFNVQLHILTFLKTLKWSNFMTSKTKLSMKVVWDLIWNIHLDLPMPENTRHWTVPTAGLQFNKIGIDQRRKYVDNDM